MRTAKRALLLLVFLLVACGLLPETDAPTREAQPTAFATASPPVTVTAGATPSPEPSDRTERGETLDQMSGGAQLVAFDWPAPPPAKAALSRDPLTSAEHQTAEQLRTEQPPVRDDVALALAYKGLKSVPQPSAAAVTSPLPVGTSQSFMIRNYNDNTNATVEAKLMAVGRHAYFWFDVTPGYTQPQAEDLASTSDAFDEIYEQVIAFFGPESNPGIDGDPRIHVFNASPLTVCDMNEENVDHCALLGYVSARDMLPTSVDRFSNEREMFVMNGRLFGRPTYLEVLAHEFRHLIEAHYDQNDADWEVEGSAMLATDLLGYGDDPARRANQFLAAPDQQLNRWSDENTTPYYGQGYLLNRYIFNRLGPDLYRDFAMHPSTGLQAIDDIALAGRLGINGRSLWLDWLAALAIHDEPGVSPKYALREGLDTVTMEVVDAYPYTLQTTVSQYAADYYRLTGEGQVTLSFTGSNHARLISVLPASGERMWLANRANFSDARLTRAVDLTGVSQATLKYQVYHAIEQGYDYAYVAASTDGGRSWQGLTAKHMQGLATEDDPGESALTARYYTGDSGTWVAEEIDLTAFAGQTIMLRFEYVTDPVLTFSGLALDNISIPEIGFYDGAETVTTWRVEGFIRATGYIPQEWYLQLVTFVDGAPVVEPLALGEDQTLTAQVSLDGQEGGYPILIVAAAAPMTLEPAHYLLALE